MMVMILKVKSRIIKMKSSIMKGVMMINSRMDFFSDLSNMLRWSWFWKWNRAWWKRGDDDQIQDGLLLRPLKCVTNGFHQRGLPCGLQVYFFCDYFIDPLIIYHHCHLRPQCLKCNANRNQINNIIIISRSSSNIIPYLINANFGTPPHNFGL